MDQIFNLVMEYTESNDLEFSGNVMHALKSIEASIFNKAKILVSRQKEELAQGHQDLMDRLDELIKQAKKNKRMIIDLQKTDTEQFSKDYKGPVKKLKK